MSEQDRCGREARAALEQLQSSRGSPASWLDEAEIRRRVRRRELFYIALPGPCLVLFAVLIGLLVARTHWSAGSFAGANGQHGRGD